MKNFDESAFLSSLSDIRWETAYAFDDVNDTWCHWESLLKQAIDHHAPLKRVNLRSGIFCIRNMVTALTRLSVKEFCFDAASVSSKCSPGLFWKKLRPLLPNSKSSFYTSSIWLLENAELYLTAVRLLMNILRLLQLMSPS